ncbi:hypothetical protein FACS1894198_3880 [Clostridia bacterium]|nr:hypothetical protein FACS1894198_3880 [Clostridia bacterium]
MVLNSISSNSDGNAGWLAAVGSNGKLYYCRDDNLSGIWAEKTIATDASLNVISPSSGARWCIAASNGNSITLRLMIQVVNGLQR